ncbi:MAG: hypothetical protein KA408_14960 [Flavobacteriales bacterium]|nr:hypothetical protein [Flavobacteriales bacterium]
MSRSYAALFALLFYADVDAQQVTTFFDAVNHVDDALFLDPGGNLYGAHYTGSSVFKRTPDGTVTTFVSGMNTPNGIAMNSLGEFYIADNVGDRIYKVANDGSPLDTIPINGPSGLLKEWDSDTILFTTYQPSSLGKLAPDGSIEITHTGAPLNGPVGLAYTEDGTLYTGNFTDRQVYRVLTASVEYVATVPGPASGVLGFITSAGSVLYGTGWNTHTIYGVDPAYTDSVWVLAGGNGQGDLDGGVDVAQFNQPNGILASSNGDTIYVSDFATKNIRMITGVRTGLHGSGAVELLQGYPNPTTGDLLLSGDLFSKGQAIWSIRGLDGALVDEGVFVVPDRSTGAVLPTNRLGAGLYSVEVLAKQYRGVLLFKKE